MKANDEYRYLYPDPELRERAEKLRKNYFYQLISSAVVSSAMAAGVVCVFFTGWVIERNLIGYAYPVFISTAFFLTFLATLQTAYYLGKTEKEQRRMIEGKPGYAKVEELYEKYDEYYKFKGKTILIAAFASVVASLPIAVFFPDKPWSAACLAIIVLGGVLHNGYYTEFRERVAPLEDQIEEEERKRENPQDDGTMF